jgi:farnesol dehydrogenase
MFYARLEKWKAEWFGAYPRITPGWVETFLEDWAYSCGKAERELGYQVTPLREGVRRTLEWLHSRAGAS